MISIICAPECTISHINTVANKIALRLPVLHLIREKWGHRKMRSGLLRVSLLNCDISPSGALLEYRNSGDMQICGPKLFHNPLQWRLTAHSHQLCRWQQGKGLEETKKSWLWTQTQTQDSDSSRTFSPSTDRLCLSFLQQKKSSLSGVCAGWCRQRSANFEAFSALFGWIRIFRIFRSHKKCQILEHAGREAEMRQIGRERQNFLHTCTPKVCTTMFYIFVIRFLFKHMWSASGFYFSCSWLVWGQWNELSQAVCTQKVVSAAIERSAPQILF